MERNDQCSPEFGHFGPGSSSDNSPASPSDLYMDYFFISLYMCYILIYRLSCSFFSYHVFWDFLHSYSFVGTFIKTCP
jgi:hypothetical protein